MIFPLFYGLMTVFSVLFRNFVSETKMILNGVSCHTLIVIYPSN